MALRRVVVTLVLLAAGLAAGLLVSARSATARPAVALSCSAGYVPAVIDGQEKCLRNGEFCSAADESQYEHYGFTCVDGHLQTFSGGQTTTAVTTTTTTTVATSTALTTTTTAAPPTAVLTVSETFVSASSSDPAGQMGAEASTSCVAGAGATLTSGVLDWGDGQSTSVGAQATNVTHVYNNSQGTYTATLTCTDSDGQSAQASQPLAPTVPATTSTGNTGPRTPVGPSAGTGETKPLLGSTVRERPRTQSHGCTRGVLPDRQCSPGAYYSGLTKAVLCSPSFRTGTIRDVPESEKHAVEVEYGMTPKSYGRTIEIDHIISLELGGSNDISNLFPEPGSGPANYHVKDKLENKLHALVCSGAMTLRAAQAGISSNWESLYARVFGGSPLA